MSSPFPGYLIAVLQFDGALNKEFILQRPVDGAMK